MILVEALPYSSLSSPKLAAHSPPNFPFRLFMTNDEEKGKLDRLIKCVCKPQKIAVELREPHQLRLSPNAENQRVDREYSDDQAISILNNVIGPVCFTPPPLINHISVFFTSTRHLLPGASPHRTDFSTNEP